MPNSNCSITLTKEKLPQIISKVEYLMFRTMEQDGTSFSKLIGKTKEAEVKRLLDVVYNKTLPEYIQKYEGMAKASIDAGDTEGFNEFKAYAQNLENLRSTWKDISNNFQAFSDTFKIKNQYTLNEQGLVEDASENADDSKVLARMVFDKSANETNPLDEIDKMVELYLKSLPNEEFSDNYGFTVSMNYAELSRQLMNDLQNSTSIDELITKLNNNKSENPVYAKIAEKLIHRADATKEETAFRIAFRNSFVKAFIPIYLVSIEEGNTIKVIEAAKGSFSLFERRIDSSFLINGFPVSDGINLAHQNENGMWIMDKSDLPKIIEYIENAPLAEKINRQFAFLQGLGIELSDKTKDQLKDKKYVGNIVKDIKTNEAASSFGYIYGYLKTLLNNNVSLDAPYSALKKDFYEEDPQNTRYKIKTAGQNNTLSDIIRLELKNNKAYNVEKSQVNPEGNLQFALQQHNNFTVVNKFLSDFDLYPTLQDILDKEPSAFWLDPKTNVNVRNSMLMHSLFYYNPNDINYGKRRRVIKTEKGALEYSLTEGDYVIVKIVNTGGIQTKTSGERPEGSSSTSLNAIDKLLQDINSFYSVGYNSVLRLGDKATDLGMGMNYYLDPITNTPQVRPLSNVGNFESIFNQPLFTSAIINALKDTIQMKYLAQRGFLEEYKNSPTNLKNTWGYFDSILSDETKEDIDSFLTDSEKIFHIDDATSLAEIFEDDINADIVSYFKEASKEFINKFADIRKIQSDKALIASNKKLGSNFQKQVEYYLANAFLLDIEQMKIFFGDPIFFKDFHKRASKDSATGIFIFAENDTLADLNNLTNLNGYGNNTNLGGRLLIEQLYQEKKITLEQRDQALLRQTVDKSFRSAVIKEIKFVSNQKTKIDENIKTIAKYGHISEAMQNLYNKFLSKIIKGDEATGKETKYAGDEADGQGKCTFDFYRTMCILTGQWGNEQEKVYEKITKYANLDDRIANETDIEKKIELLKERKALGYDPLEAVYFPPKKFQYAGPQKYTKSIEGEEYNTYVPAFDKFSLQPLIPTIIKGTPDEHFNKRMQFQGLSYVKFESASKLENPTTDLQTEYYVNYDKNTPETRSIAPFSPELGFKSTQELFLTHLKEQVAIDAEIHDHVIFGSQIRKLIMMNLARIPGFSALQSQYTRYIDELVQLEKTKVYDDLGVVAKDGTLKVSNLPKLIDYFFKEIDKKNQSSTVKKALAYDEKTKEFKMPLDGAVQAQVIEGIIISAINNKIVRYNTNGSMLTQVSIAGSEQIKPFDKAKSQKALETFGNSELKYYGVVENDKGVSVTKMEVKIGLTGQWLKLLTRNHPDGSVIGTLERLNEAIKNPTWNRAHEKELSCVSYRIPTQGRNFLDTMVVAQFLPAAFGDAIIMPTEAIIKNGGDFDIDKMFMFYPNLTKDGYYQDAFYNKEDLGDIKQYNKLKGAIQNRLFNVMQQIILHPANYMELVTPSENYHILPLVDNIYKQLDLPFDSKGNRLKTDYKNTDIINRSKNIEKFLSLMKGKSDLGIAAKANVFNVLYQLADAKANSSFLVSKQITTFFNAPTLTKVEDYLTGIDFSQTFDEDGMLKSEFFSEFINAFVDAAKDDYVFAMNMVTELSPIAFYMKYMGLSTPKILYFLNQPIIRDYIKTLMTYQNKFAKSSDKITDSIRHDAKLRVLEQYGFDTTYQDINGNLISLPSNKLASELSDFINLKGFQDKTKVFTADQLLKRIKPDEDRKLEIKEQTVQLAMMLELLNLKPQSDSITESQRYLDFDTNPYTSSFDIFSRNRAYKEGLIGGNILSSTTLKNIKENSIISPLDVYKDLAYLLADLLPVRNSIQLNQFLLGKATTLKENPDFPAIKTADDMERFARTAKNDLMNYILQNYIGKSKEGMQTFKSLFETNKDFNTYLAELVSTRKLVDMFNVIKSLDSFKDLSEQYPIVNNLVLRLGENNKQMISYQLVENTENKIEKESIISQFEHLANLQDPENKMIRDFFRNLALYGMFQSGFNKSEFSFSDISPTSIVNSLYGEAVKEFTKDDTPKATVYNNFYDQFVTNNPTFFSNPINATPTREVSKKGKWYSNQVTLTWASDFEKTNGENLVQKEKALVKTIDDKVKAVIPQNKVGNLESFGSTVRVNPEVEKVLGPNAHSIDMIIAGLRTRTTRSATEIAKYNIKIGDVIKHQGKSVDGTIKEVLARVTAIHQQNTPGWKGTWNKEGWAANDVNVIDRMNPGAAAVEFELLTSSNPLEKSGVSPTDMHGNAAKDITMAGMATQFIGYGTVLKEGVQSSTNKYAAAWGDKANTGSYTAADVIMVSGSGNFGRGGVDKATEAAAIKATLSEKYKPLLEKAIAARATFVVGNQYAKGNLSDEMIAKFLAQKGYTETKNNGFSIWKAGIKNTINTTEKVVTLESTIQELMNDIPWKYDMTPGDIVNMYNIDKLSGETIEEFFKRLACLGKIK